MGIAETQAQGATGSRPPRGVARPLLGAGVALAFAAGLAVRIWSIGREAANADEAVVGLMAREILHGHFFAFYWGQTYGGAEPYLVAFVFAIFGQSSASLAATPLILDVVAAVLVWRIGRRLFSPTVGIGAAVLFWIFPEVVVHLSVIEYGFRWVTLDCGLATLLIALRLAEPGRTRDGRNLAQWALLGLVVGVGWWSSPEVVYYAVPGLGLLIYRRARRRSTWGPSEVALFVVGAVIGALPWIWANVRSAFASLRSGPQPPQTNGPFVHHLAIFFAKVVPIYLDLRLRGLGHWFPDRDVALCCYALVLVVLGGFALVLLRRRQALVLVATGVLAPIFYALSPFTWYWSDGRYGIYLAPILSLGLAGALAEAASLLSRRRPRVAASGVRVALALGVVVAGCFSVGAMTKLSPYRPHTVSKLIGTGLGAFQTDPTGTFAKLDAALVRDGIRDVYANYWVAMPMTFESRGTLIAVDPGFVRYRPYVDAVDAAPHASWVIVPPRYRTAIATLSSSPFVDPGCLDTLERCVSAPLLEQYLRAHKIGYSQRSIGDFLIVTPHAHVQPLAVYAAYGDTAPGTT